jgi:DNA helicase IV
VQGGPGTGKTAVALHRVAYLLFEHRTRLGRDGVLVVGPNRAFLDYIANVLPSLGERSVRQTTVDELCIPRVDVTAVDDERLARWKGAAERLDDLEAAALAVIAPPADDVRVPIGARAHVIPARLIGDWLETATSGTSPVNERRERVRALARRELLRRTGSDDAWTHAAELKRAINRAWPGQKPVQLVDRMLPGPRGRRRRWTRADQLLVDEANSILNGSPFTYGHVVVDEAQDHSAVALRVIGRRSPSRSMTLVGDVAQSTTPAGQERWADVLAHLAPGSARGAVTDLTIGYRVPAPILSVANRLLPLTGVDATESRSVRMEGQPPTWHRVAPGDLADAVAAVTGDVRAHHRLTGVVAPAHLHEALRATLAAAGFAAVDHVHELARQEIPLFSPEAVKGLEFDGVVVVEPHAVLAEMGAEPITPRGARLLYVAMTRAVQRLDFVTSADPPPVLAGA